MLKLGKMYTAEGEYNIFILKNESIERLEIGTSTSKWHNIDSNILYGEYTLRVFKTFGNASLGELYKDTIKNAKKIDVPEQIDMRWNDGIFYKDYLKYLSDDEYYGFTEKEGKLDSEVCMCDGVKIIHCVSEITCDFDLEPLNYPQYKRSRKQEDIPELKWVRVQSKEYENYLFMAAVFRTFFKNSVNSDINIDSPDALRTILYDKLQLPVLNKDLDGTASVETDVVCRLARMKRENPANVIRSDFRDKHGRLVLTAARLNSAKYPAAVFLEKYRHYKELAEMYLLRRKLN